jgi:hypothetical protein
MPINLPGKKINFMITKNFLDENMKVKLYFNKNNFNYSRIILILLYDYKIKYIY